MDILETHELNQIQKEQVINLWNTQYPSSLGFKSAIEFDRFLNSVKFPIHYLLIQEHTSWMDGYFY